MEIPRNIRSKRVLLFMLYVGTPTAANTKTRVHVVFYDL